VATAQVLDKEAIYEEVTDLVRKDLPDNAGDYGLCFYYAIHTIEAIRRRGVRAILQAGSCSWPRLPEEADDGKVMTHFGYIWSPRSAQSVMNVACGGIPEMHVWAGIPEHQDIADLTTGRFVKAAAGTGMSWLDVHPPKYLWGKPPPRVLYEPIKEAVVFAFHKVCEFWSRERAVGLMH
jgi:hypothetical protein